MSRNRLRTSTTANRKQSQKKDVVDRISSMSATIEYDTLERTLKHLLFVMKEPATVTTSHSQLSTHDRSLPEDLGLQDISPCRKVIRLKCLSRQKESINWKSVYRSPWGGIYSIHSSLSQFAVVYSLEVCMRYKWSTQRRCLMVVAHFHESALPPARLTPTLR